MRALVEQGCKVIALAPRGSYSDRFKEFGIESRSYRINRAGLNPFDALRTIRELKRILSEIKPDILHTFTVKPNIYGTIAGRAANVKTIFNLVEGLGSFYVANTVKAKLIRFIIEMLEKWVFSRSNGCVFVNNDDPDYLIGKNIIKREKAILIKSVGIDTSLYSMERFSKEELRAAREEIGVDENVVVLMVARAIWDKGVREYYEAAAIVAKRLKNIRFVYVGETDSGNPSCVDRSFLEQRQVLYLGHREDIARLTAIADIYTLPSYREGLPRTLLEAASMQKPIVTTNTSGCRDVVKDGKNGFLVPIKEVKPLARKIEILAKDKELRISMGKKSREIAVNEFELQKVVEAYIELYKGYL
jgi:N,N'-diacetylbacillosaminyl-diphospho-undecaprenol alpha-1,3-N-acetylgalactosaminyltransferase